MKLYIFFSLRRGIVWFLNGWSLWAMSLWFRSLSDGISYVWQKRVDLCDANRRETELKNKGEAFTFLLWISSVCCVCLLAYQDLPFCSKHALVLGVREQKNPETMEHGSHPWHIGSILKPILKSLSKLAQDLLSCF